EACDDPVDVMPVVHVHLAFHNVHTDNLPSPPPERQSKGAEWTPLGDPSPILVENPGSRENGLRQPRMRCVSSGQARRRPLVGRQTEDVWALVVADDGEVEYQRGGG